MAAEAEELRTVLLQRVDEDIESAEESVCASKLVWEKKMGALETAKQALETAVEEERAAKESCCADERALRDLQSERDKLSSRLTTVGQGEKK